MRTHLTFLSTCLRACLLGTIYLLCVIPSLHAQLIDFDKWDDIKYLIPLCATLDTDFNLLSNSNASKNTQIQVFTGLGESDLVHVSGACRTISNSMRQIGSEARSEQNHVQNRQLPQKRVIYFNQRLQSSLLATSTSLHANLTPAGRETLSKKLGFLRVATTGLTFGDENTNNK